MVCLSLQDQGIVLLSGADDRILISFFFFFCSGDQNSNSVVLMGDGALLVPLFSESVSGQPGKRFDCKAESWDLGGS